MPLDWTRLQPHQPLPPGDPRYVERPTSTGQTVAAWVAAGRQTALIAGPVGTGKSTELARAAELLSKTHVACYLPIDRFENVRGLTGPNLLARMAWVLADHAKELKLEISEGAKGAWFARARNDSHTDGGRAAGDALIEVCREVARVSPQGRVAFLLDGLEKAPIEIVIDAMEVLGGLPPEIDLVLIVPLAFTYGARTDLVRPGERLFAHGPVEGQAIEEFFRELLVRRLNSSQSELMAAVAQNASAIQDIKRLTVWSSGLPRDFLQLAADAATYARLRRGADWPDQADLLSARMDFIESFRRALQPGDEEALRKVDGTDGRELELERKLRMLAQGLLLEVASPAGVPFKVMRPHNLVRPLLEKKKPNG